MILKSNTITIELHTIKINIENFKNLNRNKIHIFFETIEF